MFETDRGKQSIFIEGKRITRLEVTLALEEGNLLNVGASLKYSDFQLELFRFLKDWFDDAEVITIHTSGSTGKPKPMAVKKKFMIQSACITCEYLGLKPFDKILLCMPLSFIAGKMMVIRALVAGLDIYPVAPSGHPLATINQHFRFASMVPLQVFNALQVPNERERLLDIGLLLIGGGVINPTLEKALKDFPNRVYASYGMAETVSHIALRKVNGSDASLNFMPLPSVKISLSEAGTLIIDAPLVSENILFTNDMAEINQDGTFRILGRKDNVIVTGGLKIQTETLEAKLSTFIDVPFAISSLPDPKFGEIVVLAIEQTIDETLLANYLPSWQIPKKVIKVKNIPHTESGKINRTALKRLLENL